MRPSRDLSTSVEKSVSRALPGGSPPLPSWKTPICPRGRIRVSLWKGVDYAASRHRVSTAKKRQDRQGTERRVGTSSTPDRRSAPSPHPMEGEQEHQEQGEARPPRLIPPRRRHPVDNPGELLGNCRADSAENRRLCGPARGRIPDRGVTRESHVQSEPDSPEAHARLSQADVHEGRTKGPEGASQERSQAPVDGLIPTASIAPVLVGMLGGGGS